MGQVLTSKANMGLIRTHSPTQLEELRSKGYEMLNCRNQESNASNSGSPRRLSYNPINPNIQNLTTCILTWTTLCKKYIRSEPVVLTCWRQDGETLSL